MGVHCKIILDNNTVYAGGVLSGRIIYQFDSAETFQEIKLVVCGKAYIKYRQGKSHGFSIEKFLRDEITIYGGGENSTEMESGTYTHPFTYVIPLISPSSYNYYDNQRQTTSYIKYYVKTKRPTTFWTHEDAEEEFIVVKYTDLNYVPQARDTGEVNVNKNKFWLCFPSRPFFVNLSVERKGFVPGTEIPFKLECNNQSSYRANNIIVSLRLIIRYYYIIKNVNMDLQKLNIKPTKLILSEYSLGPVNTHEGKSWSRTLDIPKLQPFHSDGCRIIEFKYILHFKVKFSFPHRNLIGQIPIILGNVPIGDQPVQLSSEYSSTSIPSSAMQQPFVHQFIFTVIKDLKELKKYKIKGQLTNI